MGRFTQLWVSALARFYQVFQLAPLPAQARVSEQVKKKTVLEVCSRALKLRHSSVSGGAIKKRSRPPLRISLSLRQHDWRSPYRHWEYLPQKFNFVASKNRYFRRIHQLRKSMIVLTFIYHTCISVKFDTTASYCVMVFLSCFSSKRDGRDFSFQMCFTL